MTHRVPLFTKKKKKHDEVPYRVPNPARKHDDVPDRVPFQWRKQDALPYRLPYMQENVKEFPLGFSMYTKNDDVS